MNSRLVAAMLVTAFCQETVIVLARVTTSYRAIELEVSPLTFGVINASYAVLPIFLAIALGRFIDRGNEIRVGRISAAMIVVACIGFLWLPTVIGLMLFTAVLGISFLALSVALQVVCARVSSRADFPRVIGSYLVANAVGQTVGAYIVAAVGGDAKLPATYPLYLAALVLALLTFASSFLLRTRAKVETDKAAQPHVPMAEIFRIPRFNVLLMMGVICTAASDLTLIYLPVLGAERGYTVEFVGLLLTIRSVTTIAARALFVRLHTIMGGYSLIVSSAVLSAISSAALMLILPSWTLYIVVAIHGFALSVCQTVTMTSFITLANDSIWGTVTSIRMIGNRVGQFAFPVLASLVAALSGVGTIFAVIGLGLAMSGSAVHMRRPR
jgi:MFS family permease